MSAPAPVTFSLDADGVGWIVFDDPAARANIFTPATQGALAAALDTAGASAAKALVIASAKERIFIAGADLKWLASLADEATAAELARTGQRLFQRVVDSRVPVVCAIHGACAGGGFELALACQWRLASDAPVTQIGLPETGIGTLPGWGGSVRLPRLIGAQAALDHILKAQLLPVAAARRDGLVDEVVPAAELRARAKVAALRLAAEGIPTRATLPADAPEVFAQLRATIEAKHRGRIPALPAVIDVVEKTATLPVEAALEIEARAFGAVTVGAACKNLLHVFFLREAAKKRTLAGWFEGDISGDAAPSPRPGENAARAPRPQMNADRNQKVGVVGAGVMGSGIAQWLAAGGFDVVLRDVRPELIERGRGVIRGLFEEAVKRGKVSRGDAAAAEKRIRSTTAWEGFADCDLVIEAIVEDAAAKRKLFSELAGIVRPDALLASNTSALPIEEIAGDGPNPARTLGIHFFNPVSRMPLVELIVGQHTSPVAAARALALVKALGKSPVICRSSPGFLVTRVLFFYLNAAVRLWEDGAATETIDAALRDFGWPMGPLRLIDEVGVDVTEFIFGEMAHYFPKRFVRAMACQQLLAAGLKGRKNGASRGFYRYEGGKEVVNDAEIGPLAHAHSHQSESAGGERERVDLADHLMSVMIAEAQRCLDEGVVKSPDDIDFALLSGAGFPAWRGGLMRYGATLPPGSCPK